MAVDAVVIAVIGIPFVLAPFYGVRKLLLRIPDLTAVLLTELLTQTGSACRAVLHATAAGHAFILIHVRHVSGTGHIRGVEQLRGPQRVTDIYITVTDTENLIVAVDVGDLVYEAVVLGAL